jgi:type IV pilus assembly protein PilA
MTVKTRKALDERDKGFTLIELLVVIIIIGILAAIAIPVFLNQRKKGVDASLKSDLKNAATAIETWSTDNATTAVPTGAAGTSAALAGITPSSGNTVVVKSGGIGTYVICAYNSGASKATGSGAAMAYDSGSGGLQTALTTGCS